MRIIGPIFFFIFFFNSNGSIDNFVVDLSNERKGLLHRGHTYVRTYIHTHGHRDSMTDPAQRAESVKMV